jgi:hypothetical protein
VVAKAPRTKTNIARAAIAPIMAAASGVTDTSLPPTRLAAGVSCYSVTDPCECCRSSDGGDEYFASPCAPAVDVYPNGGFTCEPWAWLREEGNELSLAASDSCHRMLAACV